MNKVSIIVPVYNAELYLSGCVESLLNQTYKNIEIILVNDGSTDTCPKICDEYAAKDSRVKVIHKKNGGTSDAKNYGFSIMTGDYVMFLDNDDLMNMYSIEKFLETAKKYDADIVECNFYRFTNESELENLQDIKESEKVYSTEEAFSLLMKEKLKQVIWNKIYKRETIGNIYFDKGITHEDDFWTYQIFGNARIDVKISDILYFYRQHSSSVMAQRYSIKRLDGMYGRENRLYYVKEELPNLTNLAVRTFWYSAFNNYQAIVRNSNVDIDFTHRKSILEKIKKNIKPENYADWKKKDILWLKFFLLAPEWCSKLRNFVGVGV